MSGMMELSDWIKNKLWYYAKGFNIYKDIAYKNRWEMLISRDMEILRKN